MRLMSDYFQGKIARSMTGRDYLKKLTKDQLEELQADSLRRTGDSKRKTGKTYWITAKIRCTVLSQNLIEKMYKDLSASCRSTTVSRKLWSNSRGPVGSLRKDPGRSKVEHSNGEIVGPQEFRITLEIPLDAWREPEFRKQHPRIRERSVNSTCTNRRTTTQQRNRY